MGLSGADQTTPAASLLTRDKKPETNNERDRKQYPHGNTRPEGQHIRTWSTTGYDLDEFATCHWPTAVTGDSSFNGFYQWLRG